MVFIENLVFNKLDFTWLMTCETFIDWLSRKLKTSYHFLTLVKNMNVCKMILEVKHKKYGYSLKTSLTEINKASSGTVNQYRI